MGFAGFWLIEKVFEAYLAMDVGVLVAVPWRRRWRSMYAFKTSLGYIATSRTV